MCIKSGFQFFFETLSKWPKWQEVSVDIKILSPGELSAPDPWLYTFIKSCNGVYKIRGWEIVLKLATNDQSDEVFLLTSKFWPQCVVCPYRGYIHIQYKIMKNVHKIRGQRYFFWNMQPVIKVIRHFCFHKKYCLQGLSALALRLCIHVRKKTKYHIK